MFNSNDDQLDLDGRVWIIAITSLTLVALLIKSYPS